MADNFRRWGRWPIRGAYSHTGGHFRLPGFLYGWIHEDDPRRHWEINLFGLFHLRHVGPEYGAPARTQWAIGKLIFRNARWRIGEREDARRRARKRFG